MRLFLVCFFLLFASFSGALQAAQKPAKIVIATSSGSAPFEFVDEQGTAQGMFIDFWNLWSQKTGVAVEFRPAPWGETLGLMRSGGADLHAGLFYSRERDAYLDYASGLYSSDTHIFFHHDIHNINGPEDLIGFEVGVIEGDLALGFMRKGYPGVRLRVYPDNESLFEAAEKLEVKVFIKDTPIALYHLARHHLLKTFQYRKRSPLYSNMFYGAVGEGQKSLLALVKQGMQLVTKRERQAIEHRWLGNGGNAPNVLLIGLQDDNLPFSGRDLNGRASGLLVDFWRLWAGKIERSIDFMLVPRGTVLEALEKKQFDIAGDARGDLTTPMYVSLPFAHIASAFFRSSEDLGLPVGVLGKSPEERNLGKFEAVGTPMPFTHREAMIEAAVNRLIGGFVSEVLPAKKMMTDIFGRVLYAPKNAPVITELRAVVKEKELLPLVEQGLSTITVADKKVLEEQWVDNPDDLLWGKKQGLLLTGEEKQFLEDHPQIRIGVDPAYPPFDIVNDRGEYEGMGADYSALVAKKLGVDLQLVPGLDWQGVLHGVQKGAVDMVPIITNTPQRQSYMLFTKHYLEYPLVIMTTKGSPPISGIRSFVHKKLAVVEGYATAEHLKESFPEITPVLVSSTLAGLMAVSTQQADGFLTDLAAALYLAEKHHINNVKPAAPAEMSQPGFSIGVRRDWPILVSILNKVLETITPEERQAIRHRWLGKSDAIQAMRKAHVKLTEGEKRWLNEHRYVRLGIDPGWPPFEYQDNAQVYSGIASDYVASIAEKLAIEMQPVHGLSWSEVITKAKIHEIDVLPCVVKSPERSRYLNFTRPYLDLPMVIVTRADFPMVSAVTDFGDNRLAVVKDYVSHDFLKRDFPERQLYLAASIDSALKDLADGEVDGFVGNIAAVSYATEKLNLKTLKVAAATPYRFALSMGVRKDWPHLVTILDKALATLDDNKRQEIYKYWTSVRIEKQIDWQAVRRIAFGIAVVALFLIGATLYWTRRLAVEVQTRRATEVELLKLTRAVEHSSASVVITDSEGTIEYVNPYFEQLTGYSSAEVIGQNPRVLKSGHQGPEFYQELWQTILAGRVWRGDFCNKKKSGEEYWEAASIAPIMDDHGSITNFVAVKEDVTERRRAEKELAKALDRAEDATRAKSEFLANMSHEIRTPMNAILGLSHLCLQTMMTDKQRDYLEKIDLSARSLLRIIDDILDFSKIEAGKLSMESVNFYLEDVLSNIATMAALKAQEKGLEFVIQQEHDVPDCLVGDPLRLTQVLLNLVSNAIKFTEEGMVQVHIRPLESPNRQVNLEFAVVDSGIGMSTEQQKNIFQSFSQADSSITRRYGGSGLGLVISKRLVEMMGGAIGCSSKEGQGTTFTFSAVFERHHQEKRRRQLPPKLTGLRVLVVDDNPAARSVLHDALAGFDFIPAQVASGEECLAEIVRADRAGERYNLVLMDWKMDGLSGTETCRTIREMQLEQPAIILVTAYGRDDVRQEAENAGSDGFLVKPVTPSSLFDSIIAAICGAEDTEELCHTALKGDFGEDSLKGKRVLVVEDNKINRQIACELLTSWNILTDVAANGEEAVALVQQEKYDAVLMDIQMPVLDGLAATKAIRSLGGRFQMLPIVAMTAHAMEKDQQASQAAGMNAHVIKPLDPDHLRTVLMEWLSINQPEEQENTVAIEPIDGLDTKTALRRLSGNMNLYKQLLHEFVEENETFCEQVQEAVSHGAAEDARRLAHTLKGVSGNIGAMHVHEAAKRLEKALVDGDVVDALLEEVAHVLRPLLNAIVEQNTQKKSPMDMGKQLSENNLQVVRSQLQRVQQLAQVHDMDTKKVYAHLQVVVGDGPFREEVALLGRCIDGFDFKGAVDVCMQLLHKIGGEDGKNITR